MNKKLLAIATVGLFSASMAANATLLFTDVQYTANSVSFTVNGDLTGYGQPDSSYLDQFSIVYLGNAWTGGSGYSANTWSTSVFDNKSIEYSGNTGGFGLPNDYTWSIYSTNLTDAYANNRHVTVGFGANYLNPLATSGELQFVWGNGGNDEFHSVVGTVRLPIASSVPEPSTIALFCIGLAGIGFMRRRSV